MEDGVGLVDEILELAAGEVDGDELEALPVAGAAQVGELVGATVVVVEAVNAEDGVAVGEQRLGELRADEAGAAGDEVASHCTTPATSRPRAPEIGSASASIGLGRTIGWSASRPRSSPADARSRSFMTA